MSAKHLLEIAREYVAAGLSVIPVRADGGKAPAVPWKKYQAERPTDAELVRWFGYDTAFGIAVVCGAPSGNLEVIDFDTVAAYEKWADRLREESAALFASLTVVATPGGRHVYVRRPWPVAGNRKLAQSLDGTKTFIETRGQGGYVLAPGCPPECHPSGKTYHHLSGPPLTNIGICEDEL